MVGDALIKRQRMSQLRWISSMTGFEQLVADLLTKNSRKQNQITSGPSLLLTPLCTLITINKQSPNSFLYYNWSYIPHIRTHPQDGAKLIICNAQYQLSSLLPAYSLHSLPHCLTPFSLCFVSRKISVGQLVFSIVINQKSLVKNLPQLKNLP